MGVLATDNFNRADVNPIGGNWTTVTSEGAFKIVSNAVQPASLSADSTAYYNAVTWPNDQYAQVKVTVNETTAGNGLGPCVRASASANTFYRVVADHAGSGNIELSKFIAGSYTQIWGRTATFVNGDTLRLEVQGTTLRVYINGVQVGADATDSSIASGNAGLAYSSNTVSVSGDDWEGGDFAAAAAASRSGLYVVQQAAIVRAGSW